MSLFSIIVPSRNSQSNTIGEIKSDFDFIPQVIVTFVSFPSFIGEFGGYLSSSMYSEFGDNEFAVRFRESVIAAHPANSILDEQAVREYITPALMTKYYSRVNEMILAYCFLSVMSHLKDSESFSDSRVWERFRAELPFMNRKDHETACMFLSGLVVPTKALHLILDCVRPIIKDEGMNGSRIILRIPVIQHPSRFSKVISDCLILGNSSSKRLLSSVMDTLKDISNFTNDIELVRINALLSTMPGFSKIPTSLATLSNVTASSDLVLSLHNPQYLDYTCCDFAEQPTRFDNQNLIHSVQCSPDTNIQGFDITSNVLVHSNIQNKPVVYPGVAGFSPVFYNMEKCDSRSELFEVVNGSDFKLPTGVPPFLINRDSDSEIEIQNKVKKQDWRYSYFFYLSANSQLLPIDESNAALLSSLGVTIYPKQGTKTCEEIFVPGNFERKLTDRYDLTKETLFKSMIEFLGFGPR